MLSTLDGKQITTVAHAQRFETVVAQLGHERTEEVRTELQMMEKSGSNDRLRELYAPKTSK
jgi:hypothetical protein